MLDNRIWILISKKLSGEASGTELQELDHLLSEHPCIINQLDILFACWENKKGIQGKKNDTAFGKLIERINEMNHNGSKSFNKAAYYEES